MGLLVVITRNAYLSTLSLSRQMKVFADDYERLVDFFFHLQTFFYLFAFIINKKLEINKNAVDEKILL